MPVNFANRIQTAERRPARRITLWSFVLRFLSYGYFHQGGGLGQNSRFDQARTIVENQQLAINDFWHSRMREDRFEHGKIVRLPVPKMTGSIRLRDVANTWDISLYNDKILPNNLPGTVLITVPVYWLIAALSGVVFYLLSKRLFPDCPDWVHVASTVAYGLGTMIFPFATLLFDYALVASISMMALILLFAGNLRLWKKFQQLGLAL